MAQSCGADGAPRELLKREYAWLYRQLNARLRRQLLPLFEAAELRTLILCLRYLAAEDRSAMEDLLRLSLLAPPLKRELRVATRVTPLVTALERRLGDTRPEFQGVAKTYLRQGPGGLEQALLGGHLQAALERCRLPVLKMVLAYLIDVRNLLGLYKHLRWQVPLTPPLLIGGEVGPAVAGKLWQAQDMPQLLAFLRKFAGQRGDPEAVGVEEFLLQGLAARLRRAGRDPLQPALVVDYLWRCYLATREQGLALEQDARSATLAGQEAG